MKHRLVVTDYDIEVKAPTKEDADATNTNTIDVREELYHILRLPGVYEDGVETCDGVALAGDIKSCEEDHLDINQRSMDILMRIFNKLIKKEHKPMMGSVSLGGERYIPLIQRVFRAEKLEV